MPEATQRQFHLRRCLGSGGFGEVYEATMRSPGGLETAVALKLLRADLDHEDEALSRLRDEAKVLARLDHPAIVRAFDIVELDGRLALITELVDGQDLDRCIQGPQALPPRALLQVIAQVADALDAAAHARGASGPLRIVHRDIKPSNIRIGRHGQVKLLDFGIAWFAGDREARTASEMMVGSLPYMAPERFVEREHHPASDVFSLGCCLFRGLAAEPFHDAPRLRELSNLAMAPERFEGVRARRLQLVADAPAAALLDAMLRHDAAERPTAKEVARRCDELADELSGSSLRLWCADRSWPEADPDKGSLTGQTLSEGPAEAAPAFGAVASPRIVRSSSDTLAPLTEVSPPAGEPNVPPQNTDRPVAPPAFPSIPVGMAIKNDLISQAEVDTVLQGVTPDIEGLEKPEANRLSAPLPEEPVASGSNKLVLGLIAAFVLMALLSVGLVILLAVLGVVATML